MANIGWTLSLKDALSGPAGKAANSLGALERALKQVRKEEERQARLHKAVGDVQTKTSKNMGGGRQLTLIRDQTRAWEKYNKQVAEHNRLQAKRSNTRSDMRELLDGALPGDMFGAASMGASIGIAIAKFAAGATAALWGTIAQVGAMVKSAQSFKNSTLFAFENILKSRDAAKDAFALANKTALMTGADYRESISSMNSLMAQGFDAKFADELVRAMADLRVLNPAANLEGITRAISQIKSTGRLQGDEMAQLAEAGLNVNKVYEKIGKSMGLVDGKLDKKGNKQSLVEQVQDLQAAGKVKSDVAIKAIMDSLKDQVGGKEFGATAAAKANASIDGAIARVMTLKELLLQSVNIDWSPAIRFLERVGQALSGPAGARFASKLESGFNRLIGMFDQMSDAELESFLDGAGDAFEHLTKEAVKFSGHLGRLLDRLDALEGTGGSKLFQTVSSMSDALWALIESNPLEVMGGWIDGIFASITEGISGATASIGSDMMAGIVAGLDGSSLVDAMVSAVQSAVEAAESFLGIESPSKVMKQVGRFTALGMTKGIEAETPRVQTASFKMSSAAANAGSKLGTAVTNNTSSRVFAPNVTVVGGGDADANARAFEGSMQSLALQAA